MDEYKERIVRIEDKIENINCTLKEHHTCLFGNGKPGLKYDIIKMKNSIQFNNIITTVLTTALIGNLIRWLFL